MLLSKFKQKRREGIQAGGCSALGRDWIVAQPVIKRQPGREGEVEKMGGERIKAASAAVKDMNGI